MKVKFWVLGFLVQGALFLVVSSCMSGCAPLKPDYLPVEVTHVSHLTEHEPFTDHPHSYGYNSVSLGAKWVPLPHLSISVSEGYILEREHINPITHTQWHGALMGPKEVFTGRIVYDIPLK